MGIKIDYSKCCWKDGECVSDGKCVSCSCGKSCEGCVEACPVGALTRGKLVKLNKRKCINCSACIDACEHDAISMVWDGRNNAFKIKEK